jgi:hypothetical protein
MKPRLIFDFGFLGRIAGAEAEVFPRVGSATAALAKVADWRKERRLMSGIGSVYLFDE